MERGLRYVLNRLPDYEQGLKQGETLDGLQTHVRSILQAKAALYAQRNPPSNSLEISSVLDDSRPDYKLYTGCGGNILVYAALSSLQANSNESAESVQVATALRTAQRLVANKGSRVASFYMGAAGVYALAAVLDTQNWQQHVESLASEWTPAKTEDDEVLFGKAGYLYCLLYVHKLHPEAGLQLRGLIEEVTEALFEVGLRADHTKLTYLWRGKDYLGAAHGVIGILQMLVLGLREGEGWLFSGKNCLNDYKEALERTIDYICDLQFPSGNFPSHVQDAGSPERDKLVHFCHGAPGAILTLCTAFEYFHNPRFLASASRAGDMMWEKGLLKKGNGLCHGIAGSGYAFLALYRVTSAEKWLWRALKFAEAIDAPFVQDEVARWSDPQRRAVGVPDSPYSLMEGLGGTLCFLVQVLRPETARFPGYEL